MSPSPNADSTPANSLKTIRILHAALLAGQVLFAVVVIALSNKIMINVRDTRDPLFLVVPGMAFTCLILSTVLFNLRVKGIDANAPLEKKLAMYQVAVLIRLALLEGPSLFGIVAFYLTGELFFLLISVFIMCYFFYIRPTKENVVTTLGLDYKEQGELNQ